MGRSKGGKHGSFVVGFFPPLTAFPFKACSHVLLFSVGWLPECLNRQAPAEDQTVRTESARGGEKKDSRQSIQRQKQLHA